MEDQNYQNPFLFFGFLRRYAVKIRRGMYQSFLDQINPSPVDTILDVGVSTFTGYEHLNLLEKEYRYPRNITMLGIETDHSLESMYPGTKYVQYKPGEAIPFRNNSFDICYCHAVIEHVGSRENQKKFIQDLLRVGRSLYLATPNRWFPIEPHKMIPLLHWLPIQWYRKIIAALGDDFLSKEENLNFISFAELSKIFVEAKVPFRIIPFRIFGFVSNFIVIVKR